jgi:hypothetical protein
MNANPEFDLEAAAAVPLDAITLPEAGQPAICRQCEQSFAPRKSGGKPQQFCSADCRTAHHNAERTTNQVASDTLGLSGSDTLEDKPNKSTSPGCEPVATPSRTIASPREVSRQFEDIVASAPLARPACDPDKFDWLGDPGGNVLIPTQPETAIYRNPSGQVVILQRNEDHFEDDPFVFFSEENLPRLIERLQGMAKGGD